MEMLLCEMLVLVNAFGMCLYVRVSLLCVCLHHLHGISDLSPCGKKTLLKELLPLGSTYCM